MAQEITQRKDLSHNLGTGMDNALSERWLSAARKRRAAAAWGLGRPGDGEAVHRRD